MKGSYWFKAKSKKVLFEFSIRRNITVIKGDSATGKTMLLHMLYEYLRTGKQSGYSVATNAEYYVYLRDEVGRDWTDVLFPLKNTVIFIEENNDFVFTKKFAAFVKESYHEFKEIYSNYPILENNKIQNVITEDSNSGYQFWTNLFGDSNVTSSNGNGNLIKSVQELAMGDTLVIADGAAFGSLIESCLSSFRTQTNRRISFWLPEEIKNNVPAIQIH